MSLVKPWNPKDHGWPQESKDGKWWYSTTLHRWLCVYCTVAYPLHEVDCPNHASNASLESNKDRTKQG